VEPVAAAGPSAVGCAVEPAGKGRAAAEVRAAAAPVTGAAAEACRSSLCDGSHMGTMHFAKSATWAPMPCCLAVGACYEPCKCRLRGAQVPLGDMPEVHVPTNLYEEASDAHGWRPGAASLHGHKSAWCCCGPGRNMGWGVWLGMLGA